MTPEQLMNIEYQPVMADLYSLAVVIFALSVGGMPFNSAQADDKFYRLILNGKQDIFWKAHETNFGAPFSPEFKDLMTCMLAHQPGERISLVDIQMHPFF